MRQIGQLIDNRNDDTYDSDTDNEQGIQIGGYPNNEKEHCFIKVTFIASLSLFIGHCGGCLLITLLSINHNKLDDPHTTYWAHLV